MAGRVDTAPTVPVVGLAPQALGVMGAEWRGPGAVPWCSAERPVPALAFLGGVVDKPPSPPPSHKGVRLLPESGFAAAAPVLMPAGSRCRAAGDAV